MSEKYDFFVAELTPPKEHPGRIHATDCADCGSEKSVMFNSGNVDVNCHHRGCRELNPYKRQYHLQVWVRFTVLGEELPGRLESPEDARLDLLDAAKYALEYVEADRDFNEEPLGEGPDIQDGVIRELQAAIEKAEGNA